MKNRTKVNPLPITSTEIDPPRGGRLGSAFIEAVHQNAARRRLLFRLPWGKHENELMMIVAFTDPGYLYWLWYNVENSECRRALEYLLESDRPSFVTTTCPCEKNKVEMLQVPDGYDGLSIDGAVLCCHSCYREYSGHESFEMNLKGLIHFCQQEHRKTEQRKFGRLLAKAYGISRITEKAIIKLFNPTETLAQSNGRID